MELRVAIFRGHFSPQFSRHFRLPFPEPLFQHLRLSFWEPFFRHFRVPCRERACNHFSFHFRNQCFRYFRLSFQEPLFGHLKLPFREPCLYFFPAQRQDTSMHRSAHLYHTCVSCGKLGYLKITHCETPMSTLFTREILELGSTSHTQTCFKIRRTSTSILFSSTRAIPCAQQATESGPSGLQGRPQSKSWNHVFQNQAL